MPSWVGNWQQEFQGIGGNIFKGSLQLKHAGEGQVKGSFTTLTKVGGYRGTVRGTIGRDRTLEGQ